VHLIAEGYVEGEINGVGIKSFIQQAAAATCMSVVVGPKVCVTRSGYIGWAIIAESHISVHYSSEYRQLWLDIFSCKEFDIAVVMQLARSQLNFQEHNRSILPRGLEILPQLP